MIGCVVLSSADVRDPRRFMDVLAEFSPDVEWAGLGRMAIGYLDLGEPAEPVVVAQAIGRAVRDSAAWSPAMGISGGKFPSYVAAASAQPNEAWIIMPGWEAQFLAPLPVGLLPLEDEEAHRLSLWGIRTLGRFAALPVGAVVNRLGARGRLLHQLARGCDNRPVVGQRLQEVEAESWQFESPVSDRPALEATARRLAGELARRLQGRMLVGRTVSFSLQLEDGTACQQQLVLRRPTADTGRLAGICAELLAGLRIQAAVVEIQVSLSDLIPAVGQQLDLFAHGLEQGSRLRDTVRDLIACYGHDCFHRVSLSEPDAYLLERRFRLERLDPP